MYKDKYLVNISKQYRKELFEKFNTLFIHIFDKFDLI